MKVTRFLFSVLLLGAMASTASAQSAYLNWSTCTGPINKAITADANNVLVASVIGQTQPHKAYQVYVALGSGNAGALRDAWRFDPAGCQGSSFITIAHLAPALISKACPSFQGALASIQIKDYSFDAVSGKARAVLANTYPDGNVTQVLPGQRYFLAGFIFDHTFSVIGATTPGADCGGVETPVCAHLTKASWLTLDGVELQYPFASEFVTANDASNSTGCPGATPAAATSWGAVKGTYRR
jgi:hypothetical protein